MRERERDFHILCTYANKIASHGITTIRKRDELANDFRTPRGQYTLLSEHMPVWCCTVRCSQHHSPTVPLWELWNGTTVHRTQEKNEEEEQKNKKQENEHKKRNETLSGKWRSVVLCCVLVLVFTPLLYDRKLIKLFFFSTKHMGLCDRIPCIVYSSEWNPFWNVQLVKRFNFARFGFFFFSYDRILHFQIRQYHIRFNRMSGKWKPRFSQQRRKKWNVEMVVNKRDYVHCWWFWFFFFPSILVPFTLAQHENIIRVFKHNKNATSTSIEWKNGYVSMCYPLLPFGILIFSW